MPAFVALPTLFRSVSVALVRSEVAKVAETPAALLALEGPLAGMHALMCLQSTGQREGEIAQLTAMRSHSVRRMHNRVYLHISARGEALVALLAGEWSDAQVHAQVPIERRA